MSKINNNIKCPHCSEEFQLEDVFKEHLDEINNQKLLNDEKAKRLDKAEKVYLQQKKVAEEANSEVKSLRGIIENFDKDKEEAIKDALKNKEDAMCDSWWSTNLIFPLNELFLSISDIKRERSNFFFEFNKLNKAIFIAEGLEIT